MPATESVAGTPAAAEGTRPGAKLKVASGPAPGAAPGGASARAASAAAALGGASEGAPVLGTAPGSLKVEVEVEVEVRPPSNGLKAPVSFDRPLNCSQTKSW
mmetsp:Transcript_40433/g.92862  ORF Transcript_40433/g.92862 Transcript_40433/m.92862 type:complete len:102 (-) Transcript_40433:612-917(-)